MTVAAVPEVVGTKRIHAAAGIRPRPRIHSDQQLTLRDHGAGHSTDCGIRPATAVYESEFRIGIQSRYDSAAVAEADIRERVANKEIVIGFGHPVYTVSDPRNEVIKRVAKDLSAEKRRHADV